MIRIDAYDDAPAAVATYRSLGFEIYATVEDEDADPRGLAEE
jgi:ribosomal protein S18 acetylase RimI-like enzyme